MKAQLKRKLSQVEDFEDPKISMEQYVTPPHLAADLVFTAHMQGDLEGKVVDLGTGTGILAIGAALMGSKVIAVEKDEEALKIARENAKNLGVSEEIEFVHSGVEEFSEACNTVLMNPPFSQHSEEGLKFWEAATMISEKVYGISPESSREGIKSFIESSRHRVVEQLEYQIDLPATYGFHTKESRETLVDLIITEKR
ncbi:METTL5 family protein [Candidatus Nanosalina sp. VS9-1]|uniref:METTL5 family protein n=1 Tax=Candidatus Nanosalina sp. VS9-1 TaxID=3388566 RepID=UPI0039DFD597